MGLKLDSVQSASGLWAGGGWSLLLDDRTGWGRGLENPRCTVGARLATLPPAPGLTGGPTPPKQGPLNPFLHGVRRSGLKQWFTNLAADQEAPGEL